MAATARPAAARAAAPRHVAAQAPVDGPHRAPDRDPHQDGEHDGQVGGGGAEVEAEAAIVEAPQGGPHQHHGREGADVDQPSRLPLGVTRKPSQPPQPAEADVADLVVVLLEGAVEELGGEGDEEDHRECDGRSHQGVDG